MLIFYHLFIGLMAGIILAVLFSNKTAVLYGGLGGILPDILDKPLGYIFFADSLESGRVICHTLPLAALLLILGFFIWRYNNRQILLICVGIGFVLHQLADALWTDPGFWLWPLPYRIGAALWTFPYSWFGSSHYIDIIVPGRLEPFIFILPEIIILIAGIIVSLAAYRLLRPHITSRLTMAGMIIGSVLAGGVTFLIGKCIVLDVFLTGQSADYFETMYLQELFSISEWIFAGVSFVIAALILNYPVHFSDKYRINIFRICGIGIIFLSILLPLLIISGFPIVSIYGKTSWKLLACAGLFLGGIILLLFGERVIRLDED
ncbi:MAG: metal-dependent hydrolase [Methanocorpusculum sp.]|nr:metal-dependent hydrolase [Methanocorpusculum sp.]